MTRRITPVALTLAAAFTASPVFAATIGFNNAGPGNFNTAANWTTTAGVTPYTPLAADTLHIGSTANANFSATATATLNSGAATPNFAVVTLAPTAASNNGTLNIDGAGTVLNTGTLQIGAAGTGAVNLTNNAAVVITNTAGNLQLIGTGGPGTFTGTAGTQLTMTRSGANQASLFIRSGSTFNFGGTINLSSGQHFGAINMDVGNNNSFVQNQNLVISALSQGLNLDNNDWTMSAGTSLEHTGNLVISGVGSVFDATAAGATLDSDGGTAAITLRDGGALNHNAGTFVGGQIRTMTLNDTAGDAVTFTQQDSSFRILAALTYGSGAGAGGDATYIVGAGNTLRVGASATINGSNKTLDASAAGAKLDFWTDSGSVLRPTNGGVVLFNAGTFNFDGAGARVRYLNMDLGTNTWTQQDTAFELLSLDLSSTTTNSTYNIASGQTLTVSPGGNGLRLFGGATVENTFIGAGTVNLNRASTGGLFRQGKIIADGSGNQNVLTFVRSVAGDPFSYDTNVAVTQTHGWYATDTGRLNLPALTITGATARWGDISTGATSRGLVNSIRFENWTGFDGAPAGADLLTASLLATDRSEVPVGLVDPVGVWDIGVAGFTFTNVDVTFRYDHVAAGANEALLKIFRYDGSIWVQHLNFTLDTTNNLITANDVSAFSYWAIATDAVIPEPGTLALALAGGLLMLPKRRRSA